MSSFNYYVIYKPFGMLSQFTREGEHAVLGDLWNFPKDVYPVGRLDADSEGLLLLTNDKGINTRLLDPSNAHWRTYFIQVEGDIDEAAIQKIQEPMLIKIGKETYRTMPSKASKIETPDLPERNPPIRERKSIPTSWIKLELREGKNRQVRKMTAHVGFPTLRLVRTAVGSFHAGSMKSGEVREITRAEVKLFFE
jgi:23S rRNA pseudouridine2457 synthase